jgi:putative membrane protein
MGPWHGDYYGWMGWWMPLFPILMFVIALVFLWGMFGRQGWHRGGPPARTSGEASPSPLEIAKLRYARGELTREEFEEMKRTLG